MLILKNHGKRLIAVGTIISALLCSYLPLLCRFSLRNDQTNYFLPVRMYMSDAFNQGEYMFWNPFMSGSYPIHSDMQGPVWNPIVLLLSWLFKYNSSVLSVEIFLYFFIGATGCYAFIKNFTTNNYSRVLIAISYGCGGFASSTMEFMGWIASFAFLPWAIHFFYCILKKSSLVCVIGMALSLWLMITSGYPSFLIVLGYAFFAASTSYFYYLHTQKKYPQIQRTAYSLLGSFVLFLVLSMPSIHSYLEYLKYYVRGDKATIAQLNAESFNIQYILSFIFPGGGEFWDNNVYIGLIPFLALFGVDFRKSIPTFRDKFLILSSLLVFTFSIGSSTPFRVWCADYIPLLGKFGFSHSVRVFLLFPIYIWVAPKLAMLFSAPNNVAVNKIRFAAAIACIILFTYLMVEYNRITFEKEIFRYIYYSAAVWQLVMLSIISLSTKVYKSKLLLSMVIVLDLVVSVYPVATKNGLSRTKPVVYNEFASDFYKDKKEKLLQSPHMRSRSDLYIDSKFEINALKLIPRNDFPSNTRLDTFVRYIQTSSNFDFLFSQPLIFSLDKHELKTKNLKLGYNFINADIFTTDSCEVVIQQTIHPRWRSLNSQHIISDYEGVLLKVKLVPGENKLNLYYYKKDLLIEYIISLSLLIILIPYMIKRYNKDNAVD